MMSNWKETAWNGVRFTAPAHWEPIEIGNRYLILENETGPVLELKWERIKGSFSQQKHLRRLSAAYRKQPDRSIQPARLSAGWEKALKAFDATAFTWQGDTVSGKGAILFCPQCRNATFIQFYLRESEKTESISQRLLASFQDHPESNRAKLSVFDIRAVVPKRFEPVQHHFKPGEFKICLAADKQRITLYRWSPAAVLLSAGGLEHFTKTTAGISDFESRRRISEDDQMLAYDASLSSPAAWSHWLTRIKKSKLLGFRIWHEEEKNRILAIRMDGKPPADPQLLDEITASYEST